jgi:hypothetical protein
MIKRMLTYGVIAVLAIVLIGGTIVILVRPHDVEAYGGSGGNRINFVGSNGGNIGNNTGINENTSGGGQGSGSGGNSSHGRGNASVNDEYSTPINWETITGIVTLSDSEMILNTDAGEVIVGLGQSSYREKQGFVVNVGDAVRVEGYYEDGEFKAGVVENLTSASRLELRDDSGRPMWSGWNAQNGSGRGQLTERASDSGYGESNEHGRGQGQMNGVDAGSIEIPAPIDVEALPCPICEAAADYEGPLSEDEVNALYLALNDEYHAWAVYGQVIDDFGSVRPFISIQNAEANHISSLTRIFNMYNLPVPENVWTGQVASFDSLAAACTAGVEAEIANAKLYETLFRSTNREDIVDVYVSLQRAAQEKHLPAFVRCAN